MTPCLRCGIAIAIDRPVVEVFVFLQPEDPTGLAYRALAGYVHVDCEAAHA